MAIFAANRSIISIRFLSERGYHVKYVNLNECISNVVKGFVHCHCTIVFKGIVANNHLDHLIFFIYCNRIFGPTFTLSAVFFHHILSVKYFSTVCHSTTKAQFLMSRINMYWKIPYISEILITLITVVWSLVMAFLWTWSVFDDLNPFWQTEHEYSFEEGAFLWWEYDEE